MATRVLGPGSLKIGATASAREWAGSITKCSLTASTTGEDAIPLLDGNELDGDDTTTYALAGSIVDSFERQSLQNFAIENAGKVFPFVWTPSNEGESDYSGSIKMRPISIGGDVKKKNQNDFEFPLIGAPTIGEHV